MKRSSYYFARVLNNRVTVNYYSKRNLLNGVTSLNNRRERLDFINFTSSFSIYHIPWSPPPFGWTKHGLLWSCYNILFYDIDSLLAVNIIPPPTAVDIRSITGDGTSSSKIVHEDR